MVLLLSAIERDTVVVIFNSDYSFDSFPSIFNVIPIVLKIICIINLFTLFH